MALLLRTALRSQSRAIAAHFQGLASRHTPVRAASTLLDSLASEIEHEKEALAEGMEPDLAQVMESLGRRMTIQDEPGSTEVSLVSGSERPEQITIKFNVKDVGANDMLDEFEPEEGEEEFENADISTVPFSVDVRKGDHTLRFHCVTGGEDLTIDEVEFEPKDVDYDTSYMGPEFNDLDDSLIDGFHDYLQEIGVDNEVTSFVMGYSEHKEGKEYAQWLQNVKGFLEK
mmetsp:Transcript_23671/g.69276  ORF Transcript_23671/g.69276 Transcript_23671/m.69276 type:complete len:229 (-) Transcript_23671:251-937(-)